MKVVCRLDHRKYPTGRRVTDEEMKALNLKRNSSMATGTTSSGRTPGGDMVDTFIYYRCLTSFV